MKFGRALQWCHPDLLNEGSVTAMTRDFSDIPELDETFWKNAVRNPFYKPTKTHASVRIDSDVLAWLKTQGNGYQTRMNAILREAMIRALDQKV
jgi:uncharacterized protein (DUF4415 family)